MTYEQLLHQCRRYAGAHGEYKLTDLDQFVRSCFSGNAEATIFSCLFGEAVKYIEEQRLNPPQYVSREEIIEECAKACDQNAAACDSGYHKSGGVQGYALQAEGSRHCADLVRALKVSRISSRSPADG